VLLALPALLELLPPELSFPELPPHEHKAMRRGSASHQPPEDL